MEVDSHMTLYPNVFSPLKIGAVEVKNRIEAAPQLICLDDEGMVTRDFISYFQAFARGGVGLVVVGDSAIDYANGRFHWGELDLSSDRSIAGLNVLAESIQRYGAKASIEVNHAGNLANPPKGVKVKGPSTTTIVSRDRVIHATAMTQDEIDEAVDQFASACDRALRAGFDMVFLHGGHGWMLSQWTSPLTNMRTDAYGGTPENRARFPLEVLTEIRRRVGNKLAIEYRVSAEELAPGGMVLDDTIGFLKLIQDKIDLVHVSIGTMGEPKYGIWDQPTYYDHNYLVPWAEKIKQAVDIPVTTVGSITDLESAEQILAAGKADMVAMARALVADPDLVNKSYHGKADEVRPCTRCCRCINRTAYFYPVRCAVNPTVGRGEELRCLAPAQTKKKVVVVGGGPGGMQAAMTAASRGHDVALFEKEQALGGALHAASALPFKGDLRKYLDWVTRTTLASGVDVRLGVEATAEIVKAEEPDTLIVAVGAEANRPDFPTDESAHVVLAEDVDMGAAETGRTVIVVGAGLIGCETALHLAMAGKDVTIVDVLESEHIAEDAGMIIRDMLLELLENEGVKILTETLVERVDKGSVTVSGKAWDRRELPADTVVLAAGYHPKKEAAETFRGLAYDVYFVGDCCTVENIMTAVHSGFNIASEV